MAWFIALPALAGIGGAVLGGLTAKPNVTTVNVPISVTTSGTGPAQSQASQGNNPTPTPDMISQIGTWVVIGLIAVGFVVVVPKLIPQKAK